MFTSQETYILTADIGNTMTSFVVFKGARAVDRHRIETSVSQKLFSRHVEKMLHALQRKYPKLSVVLVCSVVPSALRIVQKVFARSFQGKVLVAGKNLRIPIKNNYRAARQVGQDRLACAYAAKMLYGSPSIVIDFGTALTIDVVCAQGAYEGGVIVPGIRLSLRALAEHTALLPQVKIQKPSYLIGRNTQESILSGMFHGYTALIEGLVAKMKKKFSRRAIVILTGGYGNFMGASLKRCVDKFEPDLVLKGLLLAFCATKN